jgi:hypothetical protein
MKMKNYLGQEIPVGERAQFLQDNCDAVEEQGYTRRFTTDELNERKERLADTSIHISDIETEKKEAMQEFKERLKPFEEEKMLLIKELKEKSEFVRESCYKFIDQESRTVAYYNKLGELVSSRPVMPQEMQKTLFGINRNTGTDD